MMKPNRLTLFTIFTIIFLLFLLSSHEFGAASSIDQQSYIGLVPGMEPEESGLSHPAGIAFSSRSNQFYSVESMADPLSGSSEIKVLSVYGRGRESILLGFGIENPINMAMDDKLGRLFIYQATTQQLIELNEDSSGKLDPSPSAIYDASSFGLLDPQGMTIDSAQGHLYFLDTVGPRLVRVILQPDGSYTNATADGVNLLWAANMGLRGIAYNSDSGTFHAVSPIEQRLYEFSRSGEVISFRDLSGFNLSNIQSIMFAPSADQTDDPMESSLYLADNGISLISPTGIKSGDISMLAGTPGKIIELSLIQPLKQIDADYTAALVKTTLTSAFSKPSPDPSGLTYMSSSDRLIMTDMDVEETKGGITHWQGANLWEISLGGTVLRTANISAVFPTTVPMTNEPTGIAWNPGNGHFYISDDNNQMIFDLNPGIDGLIGTADDGWTSFPTYVENGDPEGIAYDSWRDRLYVMDGTNLEVYYYSLSGTFLGQFDVEAYGALDTESIEFNPIRGTLFILSNLSYKVIIETDSDGVKLNTINFAAASPDNPSGLAYAPASSGPPVMHFYITDRRVDNDTDPNENDGKLYEMTDPTPSGVPDTRPPVIDAGIDQSIGLAATANLVGEVTDDGLPDPGGPVTTLWTMSSGPGIVTFGDPNSLVTTATFSEIGNYALRLTGNNGEYTSYDELIVNVTNTTGSTILEVRLVGSSDDAEERNDTGSVDLTDPDLELVLDAVIQTVGMRFNGVNLPKNAIIDYAYVQFQAREINTHYVVLNVRGEKQDNPGTFTATPYDISSRIKTTAYRNWTPDDWAIVDEAGVAQRTRDIKTVITELVNRPGWSSGNSMAIIITGSGRKRTAWSYDGLRSGAPKLHIEYTISPNEAPVAVNDTYSTPEDTLLTVNQSQGVLHNDTDDSPSLTAIKYTDPSHGTVTLNSNGSFVYTPAANFTGSDSFTYYASDGQFNSNIATVTINVTPVNDAPVSVNDQYTMSDIPVLVVDAQHGVLANDTDIDNDPLTAILVAGPSHGTLTLNSNGSFTYQPNINFEGTDTFTYKANDGLLDSNISTVSITVSWGTLSYFLPIVTK